jgi:MFS family permease
VLAGPRGQLDLLGRAHSFRLLYLATLASSFGTWLAVVALTIDIFDRTHSAKWVSALLLADFLPSVVIGLAFGPLVDRLSRRHLMIAADLARFVVFAALPFANSATAIVALAGVAGFATGFFRPASQAGLPNLVERADLPAANSLLRSAEYLTIMVGTLLGGVIVAASSPDVVYALNAATFLLSAALIFKIPTRLLQTARVVSRGHWRDVADGFAIVFHSRPLLAVFVSWNLVMLTHAAMNVSEVFLAKVSLDAGDVGFGLLWAASGVGLVAGSLYASSWLAHRGLAVVYAGAIGLMALGTVTAAVSPSVWVAILCMAIGGVGNGASIVYNSLLIQWGAPDELRGRAFTVIMGTTFAVLGAGMIVAGPLTDAIGARWMFGIAGAIAAVAAVVGFALAHGISLQPAQEEAEPDAVSAVG